MLGQLISDAGRVSWNRWFRALLVTDLVFIAIYLGWAGAVTIGLDEAIPQAAKIGPEASPASIVVYAKWAVAAVMFAWIARRPGRAGFAAAALVMVMLFVDDVGEIHEQVGVKLAWRLGIGDMFGLRGGGVGEIIVMGAIACAALVVMVLGRRWISGPDVRIYWAVGVLLICLGFFGTGVDAINAMARNIPVLAFWLGLIEDAGEMIVASAIAAVPLGMVFGPQPRLA